jgi:hypothetical protein
LYRSRNLRLRSWHNRKYCIEAKSLQFLGMGTVKIQLAFTGWSFMVLLTYLKLCSKGILNYDILEL